MKKSATLLFGSLATLLVASCSLPSARDKEPVRVQTTDTKPVGEGLRVVGYSLLGAAIVVTVGRAFR